MALGGRCAELHALLAYICLLHNKPINSLNSRQRLQPTDNKRRPVLRDGVCNGIRPEIDEGLVDLRHVYARKLGTDDGGLFGACVA